MNQNTSHLVKQKKKKIPRSDASHLIIFYLIIYYLNNAFIFTILII